LGISLAFGFTVLVMVYTIGPITGTSVNPARSLGPALFAGEWRYSNCGFSLSLQLQKDFVPLWFATSFWMIDF